jgi:hypothetical protein
VQVSVDEEAPAIWSNLLPWWSLGLLIQGFDAMLSGLLQLRDKSCAETGLVWGEFSFY